MKEHLGDYIPADFLEKQIYQNKAFLYKNFQFQSEQPDNRRFFILNHTPQNDNKIIMVYCTTNIDGRKRARSRQPEVLVEISGGIHTAIPKNSIFDCQSYVVWLKSRLKNEIVGGHISPLLSLPPDITQQLYQAIAQCKTMSDSDMELIFPENDD